MRLICLIFFTGEHNWKPYKLDIFEDYIYASMYIRNKVVRINRWHNETIIVPKTIDHPIAIKIVQEQKQPHVAVLCRCPSETLCLLGPRNVTCFCPQGEKVINAQLNI